MRRPKTLGGAVNQKPQNSCLLGWPWRPSWWQPSVQAVAHSSRVAPSITMHLSLMQGQKHCSLFAAPGAVDARSTIATIAKARTALFGAIDFCLSWILLVLGLASGVCLFDEKRGGRGCIYKRGCGRCHSLASGWEFKTRVA